MRAALKAPKVEKRAYPLRYHYCARIRVPGGANLGYKAKRRLRKMFETFIEGQFLLNCTDGKWRVWSNDPGAEEKLRGLGYIRKG